MNSDFEKKLKELGFSYQCNTDGFYSLFQNNVTNPILIVQLIFSEPIETVIQLSNNGTEIEAIGSFKLKLLNKVKETYFFILAFENITNNGVEFIIIPTKELKRRLVKKNRVSKTSHKISIVFWLMADQYLYDCTNIGIEGEWYFMSRGADGRMADKTVWDYTEFLNDWNRLILF